MHLVLPYYILANYGDVDEDNESKIRDLHEKLQAIMLRRLKKDVIRELPTKSERILRVEMSAMQVCCREY